MPLGFEHNMTDFEIMRQEIQSYGPIKNNARKYYSKLADKQKLLKQAQIYANRSYVYGYQLRLITDSLNIDLSIVNDDLCMPLVHKAIDRLREFFFVGNTFDISVGMIIHCT